ncbi:hypothetical protein GCM10009557_00720 [Virgisporangium ochraceum]|uniref:Nudix hydrolase domain-containing protein n=2 Tax=Virgisporangium ochraceum TaxID=65505 RepID=A0A8J4A1J9_9ACTN|nr:hypothetical protein Voc01_090210 [Virgisporangium ochraceum]
MVVVRPIDAESRAAISAFRSHFEHYWSSSRFFVTLIGLTPDGQTLLVRNRKRGLEWPTGFIEPNENLATGAAREFQEETGFKVGHPIEIGKTPMGYFFAGRIGDRVGEGSAREISEAVFVYDLPERQEMSFNQDYGVFVQFLQMARSRFSALPEP